MSKQIKLTFSNDMNDYIQVGDKVGYKTVTEIWCCSDGHAMFCSDNDHDKYINFEQLKNELIINKEEVA